MHIDRFLSLRDTIFKNPSSYFHRYASLGREDAIETARGIWQSINLVNLRDNVLPTRERAHLILEKGRITRSAKHAPAEPRHGIRDFRGLGRRDER